MSELNFRVFGTPAPQGSKRAFYNRHTKRAQLVESSSKVKPWRQDVKHAALQTIGDREGTGDPFTTISGPVALTVSFIMPRPKSHYRTGRNAHLLRDAAPLHPAGKPDIDKLLRSTLDALGEAGVWGDDAQVVHITASKQYANGDAAGAVVLVHEVTPARVEEVA